MDGLVLDSEKIYDKAMGIASRNIGYPMDVPFMNRTRGVNGTTFSEMVFETYGINFPLEKFREMYRLEFLRIVETEGVPVKRGFWELMEELGRRKLKSCLVTSSDKNTAEYLLASARISDVFPERVCGDEVLHSKPDPYIYRRACRKIGVPPKECMVLEDSRNGIIAGHAAGCMTVMIPDLVQPDEELRKKCTYVKAHLGEVIPLLEM